MLTFCRAAVPVARPLFRVARRVSPRYSLTSAGTGDAISTPTNTSAATAVPGVGEGACNRGKGGSDKEGGWERAEAGSRRWKKVPAKERMKFQDKR